MSFQKRKCNITVIVTKKNARNMHFLEHDLELTL